VCISEIDIAGVGVGFEMEISFVDLLVAEFRPNPIATAASPAVTHMTARRIEVSCPCKSKLEYRTLERGIGGRSVSYFTLRISIILMETMKNLYINLAAGVLGVRWPSRLVATAAEDHLSSGGNCRPILAVNETGMKRHAFR